jgi:hypothetical protein
MVTVTGCAVRKTADGKREFVVIEVQGGLEICQSQATGKFYATTKKCSIPTTFDEEMAKKLIGSQIPGDVVKEDCEPYEYLNKTSGEKVILNYTYAYQLNPQGSLVGTSRELQVA